MSEKTSTEGTPEKDDKPEKKVNRLEKTIEDSVEDLERATTDISTQIGKKEDALRKEMNEINAALAELRQNLNQKAAQLRDQVKISLNWIRRGVENLEIAAYLVALAFVVVYVILILLLNLPIALQTLTPFAAVIILAVLVGYSARSAKNNLSNDTYTISQYLSDISSGISSLAARKLKSHESFEGVEHGLRSAASVTKRLLTATKEFNPALKAVYDQATFVFRLRNFTHTLTNALRFYGLKVDSESEKWLSSFQSMSSTESEWLADISKQLSRRLSTSPSIISLFYFSYVDNTEGVKNAWQKIHNNAEETTQLTRIMLASVHETAESESVEIGARILQTLDNFDPRRFDELLRSFHVNLRTLKASIIQALEHFGVKLEPLHRQAVSDFIPNDLDPLNWSDELAGFVSGLTKIQNDIITLFVCENEGDRVKTEKTLAKIRKDTKTTNELVSVLVGNGILRIPEKYGSSIDSVLRNTCDRISEQSFQSIDEIRKQLSAYFTELDNYKERLLQALVAYNIKVPESLRKRFEDSYLPPHISVSDFLGFFSDNLGIRKEVLALFYYEFTQDTPLLQRAFTDVIEHNLTKSLARLLIDLGFIESTEDREIDTDVDNLSSVLRSFQTFKLSSVQSRYQTFRGLLVWSKNLAAFCAEQALSAKAFDVDFPWLLKLLKGSASARSYEQLQIVCQEILSKSDLQQKAPDTLHAAVIATLVLFFKSQEDSRLREACQDAANSDLTSRILYHFISRQEEAQRRRQKISLKVVIEDVVTKTLDYPWIEDMRSGLLIGTVPIRISDIPTVRFEKHREEIDEIKRKKEEVSEVLKELQTSLHDFFQAELKENVILQLLQMQVISAYLITIPGGKPVISKIIETEMERVCEEFAKKDPKFSSMLVMESGAGRYTRLGIVPVGMSFEEFSVRFDEIFQEAVRRYSEEYPGQIMNRAEFTANIIRIFPVEATFKVVTGDPTAPIAVEHPVHTIRELFLSRVSDDTNLALVATARVNEPQRLALKNVVVSVFNGYTSLWLLLKNKIDSLVGTRRQLRSAFESAAFDKELLLRMDCRTMTELGQKVYSLSSVPKGREEMKKSIAEHVARILKALETRMNEQERELLANEIFERLYKIGHVLSTQ